MPCGFHKFKSNGQICSKEITVKLFYHIEQVSIPCCLEHDINNGSGGNKCELIIVSSQSGQRLQVQ